MVSPIITVSLLSALAVVSPVAETSEPTASTTPAPAIANILPADTPLVGLVNTKAEAWTSLNRFYLFQRAFTAVSKYLPPSFKLDYAKEIESLLGDQVAFAFLPKVEGTTATIDNNFVMLAPIKDESRIQPFLELLKNGDPQRVKVREYKGITILEVKPPESPKSDPSPESPSPTKKLRQFSTKKKLKLAAMPVLRNPDWLKRPRGIAIATLPGYIVTGITAQPIEQIIDASQGNTTLAQNTQFQETIKHPQYAKSLLSVYENFVTLIPLINDITKDPSLPFPIIGSDAINLEQLKDYSSFNGFVTVESEGLHFQATAYRQTPKPEKDVFQTEKHEVILSRLPAATYSAATGRNLNQKWLLLTEALSTKPQLKEYLTQLRSFVQSSTKLDLEKDITNWMDGEYAFFLFPSKGGLLGAIPNLNLGIGMALETNNRTAAEATLKKLDEFITSFSTGGVVVNTHNIKGQTVTSWDVGGNTSQSLLAYNWTDDNTVVVTTGFGAIQDLIPQPYLLLPSTYNFQTATNSLPRPNYGYFYLNGGSTLSWIYGFLPSYFNSQQFQPWKPIVGSIYSISATTSTTPNKEQFDVLMVLAPNRKPISPAIKE
ncbi:DUF3352 domain-containing protein [Fortiea sp. LEGE XX443]|uniref:DUF3352 domain-containing protein n=1 Tax=Fortiea sp. LEGE XX443 TaxID=1828611 RepID=UPI001882FBBD|nr:DUF3352 domain-containing protein [Fortiea sp. LEGE XX443]MBE9004998.1 DUF3352 domain-containing protein [Fortiea sp. LEGE XX443]